MKSHPIPSLRLRAAVAESNGLPEEADRLRRAADALKNLQECGDRADELLHEMTLLRVRIGSGRKGR